MSLIKNFIHHRYVRLNVCQSIVSRPRHTRVAFSVIIKSFDFVNLKTITLCLKTPIKALSNAWLMFNTNMYFILFIGMRCNLVVTFAAIRLQGPRFKPRPGQKFETRFLLHVHSCSPLGPQHRVPEPGDGLSNTGESPENQIQS